MAFTKAEALMRLGMPAELEKQLQEWIEGGSGTVAWGDVTGKPSTFPADPATVEAAVAAKTEIAALTSGSSAADIVAALQAS